MQCRDELWEEQKDQGTLIFGFRNGTRSLRHVNRNGVECDERRGTLRKVKRVCGYLSIKIFRHLQSLFSRP